MYRGVFIFLFLNLYFFLMMTRASAASTCHSVLITNIFSICFFVKVLCVVVVVLLLLLLLLLCGKKKMR